MLLKSAHQVLVCGRRYIYALTNSMGWLVFGFTVIVYSSALQESVSGVFVQNKIFHKNF